MMGNTSLIRTALLVALIAGFGLAATGRAPRRRSAQPAIARVIQVAGSEADARFVPLGIGKSVVIDLPRDIKDVLVADPKIANAVDPLGAPRLHHRRRRSARPTSSSSMPRAARSPASTSR